MEARLKKIAEDIFNQAADMLVLNKSVEAAYFVLKDREVLCLPVSFGSSEDKDEASWAINGFCRKIDADALFLVSETWSVVRATLHDPSEGAVSEQPDRVENLMVMFIDGHGRGDVLFAEILRNDAGDPQIRESSWFGVGNVGGKMLLPWKLGSVQ